MILYTVLLLLLPLMLRCQHPLVYDFTEQDMQVFEREAVGG